MKKALFLILFVFSSILASAQQAPKNTITYEGHEYFINGLNVPWNHFGGDFGTHIWWGAMYDGDWFDNFFKECSEHGANVVRLWIHCDGRTSPMFLEDGTPAGLEPGFFVDMDDMFRRAKKYNVMVMPCIWSFDMCKNFPDAGPNGGRHHDMLIEDSKMEAYITKVWEPLVKRYANECALFSWEVCNEPEWALDRSEIGDTNWTYRSDHVVPIERMQKLTGWMAAIVHKYSDKMVTTGSASIRWNSDVAPSVGNWWSDKALAKATDGMEGAYLDYYQVHYYDYMVAMGGDIYGDDYPVSHWELDKPIIIGETPSDTSKAKIYKVDEVIQRAYKNGFAGIMYWSHNAKDGVGAWDDFKDVLKDFKKEHPKEVEPAPCPCNFLKKDLAQLQASKEGSNISLTWKAEDPFYLSAFSIEVSTDGENFKAWKSVERIDEKTIDYSYKKKFKGDAKAVRIIQKDVYGWEKTSDVIKL